MTLPKSKTLCIICKRITNKNSTHPSVHLPPESRAFKCFVCTDKTNKGASNFKFFSTNSNLKKHFKNYHPKLEVDFKNDPRISNNVTRCTIPNCLYASTKRTILQQHMLKHYYNILNN